MRVHVEFEPGVGPMDRGVVEDAVVEALGGDTVAEVTGGGTLMGDVIRSDFDVELAANRSEEEVIATCRSVMGAMGFSLRTTVWVEAGERRAEFQVGGDASDS